MEKTIWILAGSTPVPDLHVFFSAPEIRKRLAGCYCPGHGALDSRDAPDAVFPDRALRDCIRSLRSRNIHTGIVTAGLPDPSRIPATIRDLVPPGITVRCVWYAVRQDLLAELLYCHCVEDTAIRYGGDMDRGFLDMIAPQLDHRMLLRPWSDALGKESIIVRPCGSAKEGVQEWILRDFCRIAGIVPGGHFTIPPDSIPLPLGPHQTEFLRICNNHLRDLPDIHRFLLGQFRSSRFRNRQAGRVLLSPAERRGILMMHDAANRQVAREYLFSEDRGLFDDPWPEPDAPFEPFTGLTPEELAPMLMELIYEQHAPWERPQQPVRVACDLANRILHRMNARDTGRDPARPPAHDQTVSMLPSRHTTVTTGGRPPLNAASGTIEELVVSTAGCMYDRNLRLRRYRRAGPALTVINSILSRAFQQVPSRQRTRIRVLLQGEGYLNG